MENISDHDLLDGDHFSRNDLKSRLHRMNINFNVYEQKKSYFSKLYNEAIRLKSNRELIKDLLEKDIGINGSSKEKRKSTDDQGLENEIAGKQMKKDDQTDNNAATSKTSREKMLNLKKMLSQVEKKEEIKVDADPFPEFVPKKAELEEKRKSNTPVKEGTLEEDISKVKAMKQLVPQKIQVVKFFKIPTQMPNKADETHEIISTHQDVPQKVKMIEVKTSKVQTLQPLQVNTRNTTNQMVERVQDEASEIIERIPSIKEKFDKIPLTNKSNVVYRTNFRRSEPANISSINGKETAYRRTDSNDKPSTTILSVIPNGGIQNYSNQHHPQVEENYKNPNVTIQTNRPTGSNPEPPRNPEWKLEDGPQRNMMKYLIIGTAASVVLLGLYKCISNSNIPFMSINEVQAPIKEISPETNEDSSTTLLLSPFRFIYGLFTDPIGTLKKGFKSVLFYVARDLLWEYFKEYMWHIGISFLFSSIMYYAHKKYKDRQNINLIFKDVKDKLRTIYEGCNRTYQDGASEEEIIYEFSKKYNYSDDYFRNNIMPVLREKRKKDGTIKEFETFINGRIRTAWQWTGY